MSELNVYHHELRPNEYAEFYLKSEADKVFADLEESHKMEVEQLLMEIVELKQKINESQTELELWRDGSIISEAHQKEIDEKRHSDYKWCLAMARWCKDMSVWWNDEQVLRLNEQTGNAKSRRFQEAHKKFVFFFKWHKRWLELAERFK